MPISGIPIFSMLRTKMQWHQERQRLLAENVSNSDTPNFRPRDLAPLKIDGPTPGSAAAGIAGTPSASAPVVLARTDPAHLAGSQTSARFHTGRRGVFEIRPAGNAVMLEDEMLKVAANQMDFQAATSLYGRSLGLIKTAIRR